MPRILLLVLAFSLAGCQPPPSTATSAAPKMAASAPAPSPLTPDAPPKWEVHFSPHGGCTEQTVKYINEATESIFLQAYSFTSKPIADALVAKKAAGKDVEALLDKSDVTEKGTLLPMMVAGGVATLVDRKHAIAHNKVMIIDQRIVLTGSFNFTNAAEGSNAENCLAIEDPALAAKYLDNWKVHQAHSDPAP